MATIYDDISDLSQPRIRLLLLEPASDPLAPLHCSLVTCSLSELPEYAAISYVWGNTPDRVTITCNGHPKEITPNLWQALVHMRHPTAQSVLWADAICINQSDMKERSGQVTLMGKIYRHAKITFIWLGLEDGYSNAVVELCQRKEHERDTGEAMPLITRLEGSDTLSLLLGFLKRPWFTRSWVIQELCLSRNPVLVVGTTTIAWHLFGAVVSQVNNEISQAMNTQRGLEAPPVDNVVVLTSLHLMRSDGFVAARALNIKKHQLDYGQKQSGLLDLLAEFRNFATTDQRDKVFALLSLVTGPSPAAVIPDYTVSANECFTNAALGIIESSQNLRILETLSVFERYRYPDLPSWVPQWDSEGRPGEPGLRLTSHIRSVDHTGDSLETWEEQLPGVTRHRHILNLEYLAPDVLALDGLVIDTVGIVGLRLRFPFAIYNSFAEDTGTERMDFLGATASRAMEMGRIGHAMADWQTLALARQPYPPTGEDSKRVFLSILYGPQADVEEARAVFDRAMEEQQPRAGWVREVSSMLGGVSTAVKHAFDGASHMWKSWDVPDQATYGAALARCWDKRLARTEGGYLVLLPWEAEQGDQIALLPGGPKPFVLRPMGGRRYKVVGACYVHGIMHGEAWSDDRAERVELV